MSEPCRRSERLVLRRLLAAELETRLNRGKAGVGEEFSVKGIKRPLDISERSVREALRRLAKLRMVRVAGTNRVVLRETRGGPEVSRQTRKLYLLTHAGYGVAIGRSKRPIALKGEYEVTFPVSTKVLREFLLDPSKMGAVEPNFVKVGGDPPEFLVTIHGSRILYRVLSSVGERMSVELSVGFDQVDAEPIWGLVVIRTMPIDGTDRSILRAERAESSINGAVALKLLINVAAGFATELFLRDIVRASGTMRNEG